MFCRGYIKRESLHHTASITQCHQNRRNNVSTTTDGHAVSGHWSSAKHRHALVERVKSQLGGELHSLYKTTMSLMIQAGGTGVFRHYGSYSVSLVVSTELPHHAWQPWRFVHTPRHWIVELGSNFRRGDPIAEVCLREFIEDVGRSSGITKLDDWQIFAQRIPSTRLKTQLYSLGMLDNILQHLYPSHKWNITLSKSYRKPKVDLDALNRFQPKKGTWSTPQGRYSFIKFLLNRFDGDLDNFYKLSYHDIFVLNGHGALESIYNKSVYKWLYTEVPEHYWQPWRFQIPIQGGWSMVNSLWAIIASNLSKGDICAKIVVRDYLDYLRDKINVSLDEVDEEAAANKLDLQTRRIISLFGGLSAMKAKLSEDSSSQRQVILDPFHERTQQPFFWNKPENRRKYLDYLKSHLGGTYESFLTASRKNFSQTGASSLLRMIPCISDIITLEYPEVYWHRTDFIEGKHRRWCEELGELFKKGDPVATAVAWNYVDKLFGDRKSLNAWYSINITDKSTLLVIQHLGGLPYILSRFYPQHKWEYKLFLPRKLDAEQTHLRERISELLE